ncbi:hypothetical protein NRIC_34880 [Enterococcus florum]|uniref:Xylose isomerase-like TIM barrel domain-containing protein n=1 Tax=Enterococcus florum TaxID=2480627 RepID=A0A4P5PBP4_9ENTE|nr:sugar phosphate isomerase/epimerase family protein [Enterococcus florum]GCF95597.1 hypothetical protein NRIC_34880 [Enterococcus florum]
MRFGACFNFIALGKEAISLENIRTIAECGYDYLELPLSTVMELSEEAFDALQQEIAKTGIHCEGCNGFLPASQRITGDTVDEAAVLHYVEKAFQRANRLGATFVVFGSPDAKTVPAEFPPEKGRQQVVDFCKKIAPLAQKHALTLVIEPLNKGECNIINTFEEGCLIADHVRHESVKVLVDYYHLMLEKEPLTHLKAYGPEHLAHVHFAKIQGRRFPVSMAEDTHYAPFIQTLKAINYQGRVSIEAFTDDLSNDAAQTLTFFKEAFV